MLLLATIAIILLLSRTLPAASGTFTLPGLSAPVTVAFDQVGRGGLDPERLRADFPILDQEIHGHPLVYLDSASSSQKPTA